MPQQCLGHLCLLVLCFSGCADDREQEARYAVVILNNYNLAPEALYFFHSAEHRPQKALSCLFAIHLLWPPQRQAAIDLDITDSQIIELNLTESSKISCTFYSLHEKMALFF